jgi:3,4-dihydroxyphenylacetate 2,3-dioxygenase
MGAFAGATFCTHVPLLQTYDETFRREFMKLRTTSPAAGIEAMYREKVEPLDFDTFLIADTHWFTTLQYIVNAHARVAGVYTSEEVPELFHEYAYDFPGSPELADLIADEANHHSDGRSRCLASRHQGLPMHYATLTTMHYLNPKRDKKVVSMSVVQTSEPHNDLEFGAAIGRAVQRYRGRVVFVGSGSLSHRFHTFDHLLQHLPPDPQHIVTPLHRAMDEAVLGLMRQGRHRELIEMAPSYRASCSPEGFFAHYLMMAGAQGAAGWTAKGTQYGDYENAIGTGQATIWFDGGTP